MEQIVLNNATVAKMELGLNVQDSLDDIPTLLDFSISWADHEDWTFVLKRCSELGRQTMNLRTSKTTEIVILRDDETWSVRGWAGLDLSRTPGYPEIFSSHLEPGFRNYPLWLAMHHARLQKALAREAEFLFLRIHGDYFDAVNRGKGVSSIFSLLMPESLDPDFRNLCRGCELFDRSCQYQSFMTLDTAKMLEHIQLRFGTLPPAFPLRLTLDKSKMRNPSRDTKVDMEWKK